MKEGRLLRAEMESTAVLGLEKPKNESVFVEVLLENGVRIFGLDVVLITNYVSLPQRFWVRSGRYRVLYGCPGYEQSYNTSQSALFEVGKKMTLRCRENELIATSGAQS